MTLALQETELYERLNCSDNLAYSYIKDERLSNDLWNIEQDLPPLIEDSRIRSVTNVSFKEISLFWLKELTKLAALVAVSSRKWGLATLLGVLSATRKFDTWLIKQGYITPSVLTLQVVQQYRRDSPGDQNSLQILLNLLQKLDCIKFRVAWPRNYKTNHITTIPEKVKHKLDLGLLELEKPIYLVFKLHAALGTRSSEIPKIPLDCLRWREGTPRIRLCTGKMDDSQREQDLPEELLALVQEQQALVREKFGEDFTWLFPHWVWKVQGFAKRKWPPSFEYFPEQGRKVSIKLNTLLKCLIKENDIRTENGELAHVTTHMFRRTFGTVADRMGKRPDQIQHALRHANPDMQDHYVAVSPQAQEKRIERVLVNKDGKPTVYRTDRDTEFLRREWAAREVELGICVRPNIFQDCEFEHICLQCEHVRYAPEHLPQLLKIREDYQQLLERSIELGQSDSRRANSAQQFISKLDPIITNLEKSASLEVSNE